MAINVQILRVQNFWIINYCYLVINDVTKSAVMIDPAWEINKIENSFREHNVHLGGILLTHHHKDHVNLADPLAKKYRVPVYMSQIEIDCYNFHCANLTPIKEFNAFNLDGIEINPIFTPGHTEGSTSYLISKNFFTGDTLFIEGCGLCKNNVAAGLMFDTLQMIKTRISLDTLIYPGHSYGQPVGKAFKFLDLHNVYLLINNRNDFIEFRMRPNQKKLFDFQ